MKKVQILQLNCMIPRLQEAPFSELKEGDIFLLEADDSDDIYECMVYEALSDATPHPMLQPNNEEDNYIVNCEKHDESDDIISFFSDVLTFKKEEDSNDSGEDTIQDLGWETYEV